MPKTLTAKALHEETGRERWDRPNISVLAVGPDGTIYRVTGYESPDRENFVLILSDLELPKLDLSNVTPAENPVV
jgi:hypothetical protein